MEYILIITSINKKMVFTKRNDSWWWMFWHFKIIFSCPIHIATWAPCCKLLVMMKWCSSCRFQLQLWGGGRPKSLTNVKLIVSFERMVHQTSWSQNAIVSNDLSNHNLFKEALDLGVMITWRFYGCYPKTRRSNYKPTCENETNWKKNWER
jgi:hypothetical protein